MARIKNKHGLTPQQEAFCQYVVDAYGTETRGILIAAYRKAYNCKSDVRANTHYELASRLYNNVKIRSRIEQLQEEQARIATITRDELITRNANKIRLDPLELFYKDNETGRLRMKPLDELPKRIREIFNLDTGGKMTPTINKEAAEDRIIRMLGYDAKKDITINGLNPFAGEICIGFDDDEDDSEM